MPLPALNLISSRRFLSLGSSIRILAISVLALSILVPFASASLPQEETSVAPLPVFEFHSGFWLNLHHTLYHLARLQRGSSTPPGAVVLPGLTPAEQHTWDNAVSYYVQNYADKDLLFSLELILIKNQLGDFETCSDLAGLKKRTCDAGLPQKLTEALDNAAPIYRSHLWPEHDRTNRKWIFSVAPFIRRNGLELSQRLSEIYQTPWPKERIRVDVTLFANTEGAYTTLDPLRITASSVDARNQGPEALEVLFHEASHGISDSVQSAITRQCRQREKPVPRDLWHALLFYTTGEVIRATIKANAPGSSALKETYTPYAVREGLYKRGWENYLDILKRFWQPYLDGEVSFEDAIAHMVSSL